MNDNIPFFDGHNDTLLKYIRKANFDFFARNEDTHIDLPRAFEAKFGGGFFAVFIPNDISPDAPRTDFSQYQTETGYDVPFPKPITLEFAQSVAMRLSAHLFRIEKQSEGKVKVVRTADEIDQCLRDGTLATILHFEGAEPIDPDLNALEVFYQAGLRSLGLVWSRPNAFAHGVPFRFPSTPDTGDGLTDAGKALVKACNDMGILVDLSHLNEKGFWDVAKLSDAPLVATHSNVHAICPHTRNLTDKQLDAIKESDGMVGLNFAVAFLREDSANESDTPLETMVRHIDYLVERLGIDRVGFGSDFDGATIPDAIGDVTGVPKLIEALRQNGYDNASLKKIAHENWTRVLRKTWKV
jgi:membrane dipeptidase